MCVVEPGWAQLGSLPCSTSLSFSPGVTGLAMAGPQEDKQECAQPPGTQAQNRCTVPPASFYSSKQVTRPSPGTATSLGKSRDIGRGEELGPMSCTTAVPVLVKNVSTHSLTLFSKGGALECGPGFLTSF